MKVDIQATLFNLIKEKIGNDDSLGRALADVLNVSQDAVYRRYRGETALTIHEIQKICSYYGISFDSLLDIQQNRVVFQYRSLEAYDFSLDAYLEGILAGVKQIKSFTNPTIVLTVKDSPLFQLLNFPHLFRFKLYFWAKSYLNIDQYKTEQFTHEKTAEKTFLMGKEILQIYNSIPSKEIYDYDLMRGFIRQIQYYFDAYLFKDPHYAIRLLTEMQMLLNHMKAQVTIGKKFMYGTQAPASGCEYEVFLNDTTISDSTYFFKSIEKKGLYVTHNMMNYLQTTDEIYVNESEQILNKTTGKFEFN
ncbi:MAG: helix-turn-helix domain-containing protein [Flavobacteriia bacterium]|nr:helix-turn-helix domain-containing protein [Flavobacteriia bacterium]